MRSRLRRHLPIAIAAILLFALPEMARAQTATPPLRTEPSQKVLERAAGEGPVHEPPPTSVELEPGAQSAPDIVAPIPADAPPRGKLELGPVMVDPYPDNPRCFVAGRYVPAPPLCPN
jgi:hypothetical protein